MSNTYKRFLPALLIFILSLSATYAQTGKIQGFVFDSQYNDPLPGANIYLEGTSIGAATDLNGKYVIAQVPAGDYKMVVKYIGYVDKVVDVSVTADQTLEQVVTLDFESIEGEVIEVTAQAEGQMQAINQQLASDKIANIVSETKIQELPDFNAASALSRLPGISTTQSSGEDNKVVIRGLSPKYNSIEVDGVKLSATGSSSIGLTSDVYVSTNGVQNDRSVDLTMVSPYMIRTIAVYKSLTPDMNANSIGGTVNMELREAPIEPHWDFMWQSGFTAKSGNYGNYRLVASGSKRFFDDKLGLYALANFESYDRDADNLNANWAIGGEEIEIDPVTGYRPVKVNSVTFNRHIETRDRYGANLIMDYKIPNGSIKFVNMFARLQSDYTEHRQNINYNNGRLEWQMRQGENSIDQQLHSLKLDYDLNYMTADLSVSYTASRNLLDKSPVINFNQVGGVKVVQDARFNVIPENLSYLHQYGSDSSVVLRSGNLFTNDYDENRLSFKADFEVPFNIGTAVSGAFKFGGQFYKQENNTDQEAPYLGFDGDAGGDATNIANNLMRSVQNEFGIDINDAGEFIGTSFHNKDRDLFDPFLDGDFGNIFYASNPKLLKRIMNYIVGNPAFDASDATLSSGRVGGWYDGPYQQLTNDYNFDEDYYAAYAMTNVNWWDFTLIGGIRYEKVKSDYFAYNAIDQRNAQIQKMYDTTSVSQNDFILPQGQIKYSPFSWMDVRYAYTQSLARPDYQALSPKFTITQNNQVFSGNPDLKPAKAQNHDLSFTFHSNKLGLLTIGGFYKSIKNFVYQASYRLDAARNALVDSVENYQVIRNGAVVVTPNDDATVFLPLNNPNEAIVKGIELDFQHNFWYLPSPFNSIVFGINYARISSETTYPFFDVEVVPRPRPQPPLAVFIDSSSTGRLIDQPNHVLNSYVGFDYKGFSARLSFLLQDNSARGNGGRFPENDSRTEEYYRFDFSASQKMPWYNSELFLNIININNEKTSWIQKSTGGYQGIQNYGLTANLGIRFRY